jgi:hypothetical protein
MFITTAVWSRIAPESCTWLGIAVPNSFWQLGALSALVALALFCGWIQGRLGWTPAEIELEPPPAAHEHDHAHHH